MTHRYFVKALSKLDRDEAPGWIGTLPVYGPVGSRCIGGMNSAQALVWNVRTSFWMRREMTSGKHH